MPIYRLGQLGMGLLGVSLLATPLAATAPLPATPPTNAGKIHLWGDSQWHYDFIPKQLSPAWKVYGSAGQVALQHGMLTINGTADAKAASVELTKHGRRYGRWETRIRSKQYSTGSQPYHVVAGLVPNGSQASNCGARDINYSEFDIASKRSRINIHNLPNVRDHYGKALDPTEWHNYAVEISKSHISWFVDGRVKMTDKRPSALSGIKLAVTFKLDAVGAAMDEGRMQMDWIRYYTLKRGNQSALPAHAAHHTTYAEAC